MLIHVINRMEFFFEVLRKRLVQRARERERQREEESDKLCGHYSLAISIKHSIRTFLIIIFCFNLFCMTSDLISIEHICTAYEYRRWACCKVTKDIVTSELPTGIA